MSSQRIVIIGAGPAGAAAAVQCKRLGVPALLVDRLGQAGGLVANGFTVENYPGLEPLSGEAFARKLRDHLARFSVTVQKGRVSRVSPRDRGFAVEGDFGEIRALAVICAVGTRPVKLDVPGAGETENNGLFYHVRDLLRYCEGQSVRAAEHPVFVIGGGEAALDYALSIARAGAQVRVLVRGHRLRARGRLVDLVERAPAVQVVFNTRLTAVQPLSGGVALQITGPKGTVSKTGRAAAVAAGRKSCAKELLGGLDIDLPGEVSTRVPGLFAAGDARMGSLGQVGMAVGDGLGAAMAAVAYAEAVERC